MKTKIIPFDLDTAKKIQAGEIEGAIKTREGYSVRLLCTDLRNEQCIAAAMSFLDGSELVVNYDHAGNFNQDSSHCKNDLVLEVPCTEPEFKPFDKVLVRYDDREEWCLALYAYYRESTKLHRMVGGACWEQCIPYEGNEHLLGTTDNPKEE